MRQQASQTLLFYWCSPRRQSENFAEFPRRISLSHRKKLGMAPPLSPLLVSLRSIVGDATVSTESGRSALRGKLKARLEKASIDELRQTASSTIGGDPIEVNPGFAANSSTARRVLIDTLVERIADGAIPHPE